ncbi:hypothetical protein SUGI_0733440 [Cryptomeria japonica]|nr:hypothetical protein SUGI_0733440 [Cryptomeria japonica]
MCSRVVFSRFSGVESGPTALRDFFMAIGSYRWEKSIITVKEEFHAVDSHKAWLPDVEACTPGSKVTYPILVVAKTEIMVKLNMLGPDEKDEIGKPLASRTLHIVGPDKKIILHQSVRLSWEGIPITLGSLRSVEFSKVTYPILAVAKTEIMVKLDMLDSDEKGEIGKPLASRTLHIVGSDNKSLECCLGLQADKANASAILVGDVVVN